MTNKAIRNGSQVWLDGVLVGTVIGKIGDTLLRIRRKDGTTIRLDAASCTFNNPAGRQHNGPKMVAPKASGISPQ
jgi:hypothetical protein